MTVFRLTLELRTSLPASLKDGQSLTFLTSGVSFLSIVSSMTVIFETSGPVRRRKPIVSEGGLTRCLMGQTIDPSKLSVEMVIALRRLLRYIGRLLRHFQFRILTTPSMTHILTSCRLIP
jgi:hypothetical protein